MKNWCDLARECPYFVAEWNRAKNELRLTCKGEWGRTCLIWKELEVMIPNHRITSFKMSKTDHRRDVNA